MYTALLLIDTYLYNKFDLNGNSRFKVICRTRFCDRLTDRQSGDYMLPPSGRIKMPKHSYNIATPSIDDPLYLITQIYPSFHISHLLPSSRQRLIYYNFTTYYLFILCSSRSSLRTVLSLK